MADKVFITLEVDDKGSAVVKKFGGNTQAAFDKMKKNANAGAVQAGKMRKAWTSSIDAIKNKWKTYSAVATVAIAAMGAAVVAAGKKFLSAASDLQEVQGKFDVVFAGQKEKAESWALTLVNSYAMSTREAKQYLSSVQDLLVPMGMAADKAGEMSNEVVKLSADLGSFNNIPTAQVMDDIQSALVGNYETMKKYGVVLNASTVQEKALAMGLAETKDGLTAGMKAQAAYALMVQGSTAAIGDMARTSESAANQEKQTKALLEDISALLGQTLIPYYQEVLKVVNDWLKANRAAIEQNLPEYIQRVGTAIGSVIEIIRFFHNGWLGLELAANVAINIIVISLDGLFAALRFVLLPLDLIFQGLVKIGTIASNPFDKIQDGLGDFVVSSVDATARVLADIEKTNKAYDSVIAKIDGWKKKIAEVPVAAAEASSSVVSSVEGTAKTIESLKPEFKINPVANTQLDEVKDKAVGVANAIENLKPTLSITASAILSKISIIQGEAIGEGVPLTRGTTGAGGYDKYGMYHKEGAYDITYENKYTTPEGRSASGSAISYQTGTGIEGLPHTGLFHGHKGEIVKNPKESDAERRGKNGNTYNITIAPQFMTGDRTAARNVAAELQRELDGLAVRRGEETGRR